MLGARQKWLTLKPISLFAENTYCIVNNHRLQNIAIPKYGLSDEKVNFDYEIVLK